MLSWYQVGSICIIIYHIKARKREIVLEFFPQITVETTEIIYAWFQSPP